MIWGDARCDFWGIQPTNITTDSQLYNLQLIPEDPQWYEEICCMLLYLQETKWASSIEIPSDPLRSSISLPQDSTSREAGHRQWSKFNLHYDDDTCPSYWGVPPRHSQLSESIPKLLPHLVFLKLPSIPKIFPTENRIHPFRGLYHSEVLTFSRFSPLQDLLRYEGFNFELEVPLTDHLWSLPTVMQLHSPPSL